MTGRGPRLAARALVLDARDRLLLVNAWPGGAGQLWCAPGGGVEVGQSLPDTLQREVMEECGLAIEVGAPALINEFHDPTRGFHQVEIFFRARMLGSLPAAWNDPAGVVSQRAFFDRQALGRIRHKPDSLAAAAWGDRTLYDPLELILPPR